MTSIVRIFLYTKHEVYWMKEGFCRFFKPFCVQWFLHNVLRYIFIPLKGDLLTKISIPLPSLSKVSIIGTAACKPETIRLQIQNEDEGGEV